MYIINKLNNNYICNINSLLDFLYRVVIFFIDYSKLTIPKKYHCY